MISDLTELYYLDDRGGGRGKIWDGIWQSTSVTILLPEKPDVNFMQFLA